jgi:hypothetical protein
MFILIGPHVRHFSDGNQTVCPTLKNKSWLPILPKQRKRCMSNCQQFSREEMLEQFDMSKEYFNRLFTCDKNSPIKMHNSSFLVQSDQNLPIYYSSLVKAVGQRPILIYRVFLKYLC